MVFQKKMSTFKNSQPKKGEKQVEADDEDMFNDMDDSDDFEADSDEEMPVQKTPKGRQSLNEKKVTFSMTGKNTPGKTPNKNNSLAMKTPTPAKGKATLQEFKGIKGGKPQQKKGAPVKEEDDDDDDDDDDEGDSDLDLDIDDDDDDEASVDEDDDDDDDDDNDSDEEEEEQKPKQNQANLTPNKQTPVKNENAKNQTPKAKVPKNEVTSPKKVASPQNISETRSLELQRRKERDLKMLFVGGLPNDVTSEELQALSSDIKNVIIPKANRKNVRSVYAFLSFESEAKAEANLKIFQNKKFRGQPFNVDFVGEKSMKRAAQVYEPKVINERKLYITGISLDATIAEVAVHFPKAYQITFNKSQSFRSATINFDTVEDASEAFKDHKEIKVKGDKLTVMHSTESNMSKRPKSKKPKKMWPMKNKNRNAKQGGNPAKKMKKEESADD